MVDRSGSLDKFGEFVTKNLRDRGIDAFDLLLRWPADRPSNQELRRELAALDPATQALARRSVIKAIDAAMHALLFALQERADFERDIEIRVDGQDVVKLSDGIHGEPFGVDGWIRRFSKHGSEPPAA